MEIGKIYYFDASKVSHGKLVKIDDNGIYFKAIKNTIYTVENGLVIFSEQRKFEEKI
jgi:methyl coenzyme M reductase gamma subunit